MVARFRSSRVNGSPSSSSAPSPATASVGRRLGVRPDALSFGVASSSAKIESALREPSRLAGAAARRMVGLGESAPDFPPKKKFLMDERAEGFDPGCVFSGPSLLLLLPSSWARRGTE